MIKSTAPSHRWRFFRAGGFDQVRLESGADLMSLDQLDQKLWVALACPIAGLEFDPKTAALIDTDHDGRIRAPELIAAVQWAGGALKIPDTLIQGGDSLSLDAINDAHRPRKTNPRLRPAHSGPSGPTRRRARDSGAGDGRQQRLRLRAVQRRRRHRAGSAPTIRRWRPSSAKSLSAWVAVNDRSGKPGIDQERADKFFEACAAFDGLDETGGGGRRAPFCPPARTPPPPPPPFRPSSRRWMIISAAVAWRRSIRAPSIFSIARRRNTFRSPRTT